MNPEISPSRSYLQTLHDELLNTFSKVLSVCEAIEDAHSQLSAIHSGQSWLREQEVPCPPMSELYKIEHELVFTRRELTQLIDLGYHALRDLKKRFGDLQSDPL
jgi:hypothetical protein